MIRTSLMTSGSTDPKSRSARQGQPRHLLAAGRELADSGSLRDPHVLAEEIADDLRASLEQIEDILADLQERANEAQHWRDVEAV